MVGTAALDTAEGALDIAEAGPTGDTRSARESPMRVGRIRRDGEQTRVDMWPVEYQDRLQRQSAANCQVEAFGLHHMAHKLQLEGLHTRRDTKTEVSLALRHRELRQKPVLGERLEPHLG